MRTMLLALLAALVLGACAGDEAALPPNDGDAAAPDPAGTCLEGEPDCADDLSGGEDVTELPSELGDVTIADLLDGTATGRVTVAGFIVASGDEVRLCEALAESYPPQCGGASIPLTGFGEVELEGLPNEGDVTWSDFPVTVEGEVVDGVLVVG